MGEMEMERRNNYRFSLLSINCSNWTFGHFVVDDDLWLQLCNLFASQEGQGETGEGDFYIHLPGDLVLPVLFISSLIYCCLMERDERLNNPASDTGAIRWWWGSFCNNSLISRNLLIFLCNRHPVASECVLWAYLFSNATPPRWCCHGLWISTKLCLQEQLTRRWARSAAGSGCVSLLSLWKCNSGIIIDI